MQRPSSGATILPGAAWPVEREDFGSHCRGGPAQMLTAHAPPLWALAENSRLARHLEGSFFLQLLLSNIFDGIGIKSFQG